MEVNQDQNGREPGNEVDQEVRKSDDAEVAEPPSKKPKITERISRKQNPNVISKEELQDEYSEGKTRMGKQEKLFPKKELKEDVKGEVEHHVEEEVYPGQLIPKEELKNEYGEGERDIGKPGLVSKNEPKEEMVHMRTIKGRLYDLRCIFCKVLPRKSSPNRSELYRHYAREHFCEQLKRDYGDPEFCPFCQYVKKQFMQEMVMVKHIGQVHAKVEDYLPEEAKIPGRGQKGNLSKKKSEAPALCADGADELLEESFSREQTSEGGLGLLFLKNEHREQVAEPERLPEEKLKNEYSEGEVGGQQMQGASFIGLVPKKEPKENFEDKIEVSAGEDVKPFSDGSTLKEEPKEEYGEGETRQQKQEASFREFIPKREPKGVKKERVLGDGVKPFSDANVTKEEFKEEYSEGLFGRPQKQDASFCELLPKMELKENVKEETEHSAQEVSPGWFRLVSFKEEPKAEYGEEESKRGGSPPASPFHGFPSPSHAFSLPASRPKTQLKRLIEELEEPDPTI